MTRHLANLRESCDCFVKFIDGGWWLNQVGLIFSQEEISVTIIKIKLSRAAAHSPTLSATHGQIM